MDLTGTEEKINLPYFLQKSSPGKKDDVTVIPETPDIETPQKVVSYNHGFYIRWLLISRCARMMETRSFSE